MQGISLKLVASADEDYITAVLEIKSSKPLPHFQCPEGS